MTNRQAWFCPACKVHHAPHVDTCPKSAEVVTMPTTQVWPGIVPWPQYDPRDCYSGVPTVDFGHILVGSYDPHLNRRKGYGVTS